MIVNMRDLVIIKSLSINTSIPIENLLLAISKVKMYSSFKFILK